jgi:uncharacterized GH25 family protein
MSVDTGVVAGRVVDSAGEPVAGATVAVKSSTQPHPDIAAFTSDAGAFELSGLRPGSYVLEAREGSASASAHVEVAAGEAVHVEFCLV